MDARALDDLTNKLSNASVAGGGVSFAKKSLVLDSANDAKIVIDALKSCSNLEYFNLEGNTLGVEAAKAIGLALATHPELERALWRDMFTGRKKDEIPQALRHLGNGLDTANVRLKELDLSDNAFGPIGMEGLASLLRSSSCHSLQVLKLNNNGLGITGAKLLSKALMDCYESSKAGGKPLPLRVFIAGRNRLENEGIKALSNVFKVLGTLEEIQIPQNGIYHIGIRELSEALKRNSGLKVLNLNDNTLGSKGSTALAFALPSLQMLRHVNLGDCLLKTAGALSIAGGLQLRHQNLEELLLDHNEIKKEGGLAIVQAMHNKSKLKVLSLDGNQFGDNGVKMITDEMRKINKESVLAPFEENESEDDEEDEEEDEVEDATEETDEDEQNESEEEVENKKDQSFTKEVSSVEQAMISLLKQITAADFLQFPSPERFLALESNKAEQILSEVKEGPEEEYMERLLSSLMKVSGLASDPTPGVSQAAVDCSNALYRELFSWAQANDRLSLANNNLLVHLGLIKSEDKKWKADYNQSGCYTALKKAMEQNYFPQTSRDTVLCFIQRKESPVETITLS